MSERELSQERETRFPGYGDHVGGVELAPNIWKGGELVTDPELVTKSLKPKRFYYSPIGDGVVAADGVQMKWGPPDLTPRVTVIQQRVMEKGTPSQAGHRVVEKLWTTGGGGDEANAASAYTGSGLQGDPTGARQVPTPQAPPAAPPHAPAAVPQPMPIPAPVAPPAQAPKAPVASYSPRPAPQPAYETDPYGSLGSNKSSLYESRIKSPSNGTDGGYGDYPGSGRTSTTSALFSEPGMRYEMKKDYMVTNPRELIHQYATTTPITSIPGFESLPGAGQITQTIKQTYSQVTEEYGPYPPYTSGSNVPNPKKFARQLRDETMTISQKQANMNTDALCGDLDYQKINEVRQKSHRVSPNPEVDSLTSRLVTGLQTGHSNP